MTTKKDDEKKLRTRNLCFQNYNEACLVEAVQLIYLSCSIIVSKHCFVRLGGGIHTFHNYN